MRCPARIFRLLKGLLTGLLVLTSLPATADGERLYQWRDDRSGNTQLSGHPPGWYRSARSTGPRVLVYLGGQLIDDTAVPVSEALRESLRAEALAAAGVGGQTAIEAMAATPVDGPGPRDGVSPPADETPGRAGAAIPLVELARPAADPRAEAEQREQALEVLERFDAARLAAARAMVDALLPAEPPPPAAQDAAPSP